MSTTTNFDITFDMRVRGNKMYSMHEALAREHMREQVSSARHARLVRELAAARRWHRVQSYVRSAHQRHVVRAERAAHVSAVAEHSWA